MVTDQLRARGIADERVLAAMASVPREAFLDPATQAGAYRDAALPIAQGQTMSQPWIVARMTELLQIVAGDRVLEIGTGSGYQAAILAAIGARVWTIERHRALADTARERLAAHGFGDVHVEVGDGSAGAPDGAPWDGIIVAAAAPAVPPSLPGQLVIGGRLVLPVGAWGSQELLAIERRGPDEWHTERAGPVVFVPLIGVEGYPATGTGEGS